MAYDPNNIFARIIRGEAQAHRVYEDDATLAFLDLMPQSDGHTLILPKAPAENLFDLDARAAGAVILTTQKIARAVQAAFKPDGIVVMQFNGSEAGQTVFHFHMHVVPRYPGDAIRFAPMLKSYEGQSMADHGERIRRNIQP